MDRTLIVAQPPAGTTIDPVEAQRPYLVLIEDGNARCSIPVGGRPVLIGRDAACDLTLDDPCVSRRHASVDLDSDQVRLTDLDSTNGTYVNGERVQGTLPLKDGSVVKIGRHLTRLEWRAQGDVEAADELITIVDDEPTATAALG